MTVKAKHGIVAALDFAMCLGLVLNTHYILTHYPTGWELSAAVSGITFLYGLKHLWQFLHLP